jgi:glycosyltransferase involved in cell wall biosynthesis
MVSTEYPPMHGGVGQYTIKLVDSLRKKDVEVEVLCDEQGNGDFHGISPFYTDNSKVLLQLVKDSKPDLVHVQYEQGLYGMHLDAINPQKTQTGIDQFYDKCSIPIVTTFHSAYTFAQWMNLIVPLSNKRLGGLGTYFRMAFDYWTHVINYRSFSLLNRRKVGVGRAGVVFSKYLADLIPGTNLIYHGSEPSATAHSNKNVVRREFGIPEDHNIALASGFMTATKGWDIIRKMKVPKNWKIVVNSSRNHYNKERHERNFDNPGVVQLQMGFLTEHQLSLLFHAADALILPYKVSSGSGMMFDGFAHHLPFVSSDIGFFKEFSEMGLGISVERDPSKFSEALIRLEQNLKKYRRTVENFSKRITWEEVANRHLLLYKSLFDSSKSILINKKITINPSEL